MHDPNFPLDSRYPGAYIDRVVTGEQMRLVRQANGLTQEQLANLLDVKQSAISQMESGKTRINTRTAIAFATVINQHKDRQARKTA